MEGGHAMVSHLLFYQLVLLGLLWLCCMLHAAWPSRDAAGVPRPPELVPPPRKRLRVPKPFPGLTHKPHCEACAQAAVPRPQAPGAPPPRIVSTRGRPRQVDTSSHFCPQPPCAYWGWVGLGNISANGHPNGGPWRQLHCISCGGYFQETHGTPLHGKRVAPDKLVWAVGALAEGMGIRAVARVFEVDPHTVLAWLVEVAEQAAAFSQYFLHDVRVTQVQLDELFALLSAVQAGEVSEAEAITRLSRSPHWVWGALDPVTKLLLTIDVGDRTLAAIEQVLAAYGWHIQTAFIERVNLTIRQHVAAVGRRVMTLCKGEEGLHQQLVWYHGYYNFCLTHASLRQPLPQPLPTNGNGSAKRWQPQTPAMAAGLTDHVWSVREVLLFRVPPWPQPAGV